MQSGYELLKVENSTLESKLHHANIQVSECQDKLEISQLQLQESNSAKACLSSQLEMAKNGVIKMQQQLLQTESVAEERKTLMETMAEHMEQVRHENEESISAVKHEADQRDLEWKRKLEIFERNQIEMNSLRDGLENLKSKLESATATNERLSKDLMNSQVWQDHLNVSLVILYFYAAKKRLQNNQQVF